MACAVGFPALRVRGLMLVVATLAFGEAVRLFFFNFTYQVQAGNLKLGPHGAEGFRQIRYFPEHGWTTLDVVLFIWAVVVLVMAGLWWLDRSRAGAVLRAVGEDEVAAQSTGINITAAKVSAMTIGGVIAGIGGGIFAHYTTHIEHAQFGVVLATFAIAYPILGGLSNVFGTLLAVVFIQGFLIEGLRFMGDWRNLLFGALIVLAMIVRPQHGAAPALKVPQVPPADRDRVALAVDRARAEREPEDPRSDPIGDRRRGLLADCVAHRSLLALTIMSRKTPAVGGGPAGRGVRGASGTAASSSASAPPSSPSSRAVRACSTPTSSSSSRRSPTRRSTRSAKSRSCR